MIKKFSRNISSHNWGWFDLFHKVLFLFFFFLLLLCAMQWNNNDNSRFVPPRNLLAYSTVCVCSSTSCELVYFQFLPSPPVHVYSTCIRMQLRASSNLYTPIVFPFVRFPHVRAFTYVDRPRVKYFPSCNETLTFNKFVSCV